jgi:GDP-L-fucose synthase
MSNLDKHSKILVTGGTGFVGTNLVAMMKERGLNPITPSRKDYDLLEQSQARAMLKDIQPQLVFHLAGLVGGILGNRERPGDFHYENAFMGEVMLHESFKAGVAKYITVMGGCSYPADAPNPIKETSLFYGYPQELTAPYSIAKAMNAVQAAAYREQYGFNSVVLVPGNMYGPHDNYDLQRSHVIPALIRRYYEAARDKKSEVIAWGTGRPIRDFVYVRDICEALLIAAEKYNDSKLINVSSGKPITVKELTEKIAAIAGYTGTVNWDTSKPDAQKEKLFDVTRLRELLGYQCPTTLDAGLKQTYDWFAANYATARLDAA